jgi:hypothetical protein
MLRGIAPGLLFLALVTGLGCETHRTQTLPKQPRVEEFNAPPEETRYSTPAESKYVKPKKMVDLASKFGQDAVGAGPSSMPGAGGAGGGMGAMPGSGPSNFR